MEFDPVLSGPDHNQPRTPEFVDPTGLASCPDWMILPEHEAFAARLLATPDSVFACPPSWNYTPRDFKALCDEATYNGGLLNAMTYVGGMVSVIAMALCIFVGDPPTAIPFAMVLIGFGVTKWRLEAARSEARRRLKALDLDQVIEVTQPSSHLRSFAGMDAEELTFNLVRPINGALREVWEIAQSEARSPVPSIRHDPPATTSPHRTASTTDQRWTAARAAFENVESDWEAIVCDPLAALNHAALLDITRPRTATFVEQFDDTKHLLRRLGDDVPHEGDLDAFETAVRRSVSAWAEAKRHAAHLDIESLPEHEQSHADRARKALMLAMDTEAEPGERINAAREVEKALARVKSIVLPERALGAIEDVKRLAIEAATTTEPVGA